MNIDLLTRDDLTELKDIRPKGSPWMTLDEVCRYIQFPALSIQKWIDTKGFPVSKGWFNRDDVDNWMHSTPGQRPAPTDAPFDEPPPEPQNTYLEPKPKPAKRYREIGITLCSKCRSEIPESEFEKPEKQGYVYLMIDTVSGHHKIGYSTQPEVRERTLFADKPSVRLICAWEATRKEETLLHERFADSRIRGEWFDLNTIDISSIKRRFCRRRKFKEVQNDK